ncbi:abortive infection family protein [Nocardia noduli]|uniref:abortive infection family protein n=1 Tax=Nocardia noduli TaxID=2815722 RepID=UPI001C238987|nr:abortive infection family protein [Nocardia noduli]
MANDFDDDWELPPEPVKDPSEQLAEAHELIDMLLGTLIDAANPADMKSRGNSAEYARNNQKLNKILTPLKISPPFPWSTLGEAVSAAKARHSGRGSHAPRRLFFLERADRAKQALDARLSDESAGDVSAAIADFGDAAGGLVADPAAIRGELARMEASLRGDPGAAIGKAKNLIEATAKAVLTEHGVPFDPTIDFNSVVNTSMKVLRIDAASLTGYEREAMQRLTGLAFALRNLRNEAGDGHGPERPPEGLALRHGRLAVRAAIAWSAFMLDTLHDRSAAPGA